MSRHIEFNYEASLEKAARLFWKQGYANTSLRELLKKMGIGEGSFYNTMKSMKNAYLESLKHYNATVNRKREEAFSSAPTAALGIRALFKTVLDCLDDPHTPSPVCLMAGALTTEVLAEPDLRKYVEERVSALAEVMIERMVSDKKAGHLPKEFEPQFVVSVIITYLQGLWRMALVSYNRKKYEKQIDLFLGGLGL
jgi:TetR/AcrR family transcriptional regulator, transcriptional repressor for nem operon